MTRSSVIESSLREKASVRVFSCPQDASTAVAVRMATLIREKQLRGQLVVFGLATGNTPVQVYAELVRLHRSEGLSFENVVTFNLDEYYPMAPSSRLSYTSFMRHHLFDHVNIRPQHVNIPDGSLSEDAVEAYCEAYDQKIADLGGIDFQILGIGLTGHIGFNEPGSAQDSRTRLVRLADLTRRDAIETFGGLANVPEKAITMGVSSIVNAREIVLMAWTEKKAEIVKQALEGEVSPRVPATFLQSRPQVEFVLDPGAASMLKDHSSTR